MKEGIYDRKPPLETTMYAKTWREKTLANVRWVGVTGLSTIAEL